LSSAAALAKASSPQGYHCTGMVACCSRYGLVSLINRLCFAVGGAGQEGSLDEQAARAVTAAIRPAISQAVCVEMISAGGFMVSFLWIVRVCGSV